MRFLLAYTVPDKYIAPLPQKRQCSVIEGSHTHSIHFLNLFSTASYLLTIHLQWRLRMLDNYSTIPLPVISSSIHLFRCSKKQNEFWLLAYTCHYNLALQFPFLFCFRLHFWFLVPSYRSKRNVLSNYGCFHRGESQWRTIHCKEIFVPRSSFGIMGIHWKIESLSTSFTPSTHTTIGILVKFSPAFFRTKDSNSLLILL